MHFVDCTSKAMKPSNRIFRYIVMSLHQRYLKIYTRFKNWFRKTSLHGPLSVRTALLQHLFNQTSTLGNRATIRIVSVSNIKPPRLFDRIDNNVKRSVSSLKNCSGNWSASIDWFFPFSCNTNQAEDHQVCYCWGLQLCNWNIVK